MNYYVIFQCMKQSLNTNYQCISSTGISATSGYYSFSSLRTTVSTAGLYYIQVIFTSTGISSSSFRLMTYLQSDTDSTNIQNLTTRTYDVSTTSTTYVPAFSYNLVYNLSASTTLTPILYPSTTTTFNGYLILLRLK